MKKYFDTHTHPNLDPLINEIEKINQGCLENNLLANIVSVDYDSSKIALDLSKKYKNLYKATIGLHPTYVHDLSYDEINHEIDLIEELIIKNKEYIIAIGETGIDLHFRNDDETLKKQIYSLNKHVELSRKYFLPLVLHIRDAHQEILEYLLKTKISENIILHCFSGNKDVALQYLKFSNIYFSYSGTVTFKNARDLQESLSIIPKNKIICETDAPWLSPEPFRGKTNYPWYVIKTIERVVEIRKDISIEQIWDNSLLAFKLK